CLDGLAYMASQRSRQHPRRATPTEIGFQSRRQRGARSENGKRRRDETRSLTQFIGLAKRELTRPNPAERRAFSPWPYRVLVYEAGCDSGEPAPAGIVGWACIFHCRGSSWREAQSLDDLPALGKPQPGAPGNEWVRNVKRQCAAREWQAVRHEALAEFRQQPVGAWRLAGFVDEPGERRRKLHGAIMGLTQHPCHELSLTMGFSAPIRAAQPRRHP